MKIHKRYYYIGGGIIAAILIFYGGMILGKSQTRQAMPGAQQRGSIGGGFAARNGGNAIQNGGITSGQIVSVDSQGITIQLRDGSSKIILVPSSATILKSTAGSISDLTRDEQVTITGLINSDGSVTAQSIQIRPAQPNQNR